MKAVKKSWGSYKVLAQGKNWKLKVLTIKPYKCTSLQKHVHRSEVHIDLDNRKAPFDCRVIPAGALHQLGNNTFQDIHILELQFGQECKEKDIVRCQK
jgi:mannose-1-phosphate guanylyltransferase/mannose-6-phosphate isomerase